MDTRRHKRGLLNGAGSILNAITEILNAEDGEFIKNSMNRFNWRLLNLLKNQITVTFSVTKNFKETIGKLLIDEETFNYDINNINTAVHELYEDTIIIEAKLYMWETNGEVPILRRQSESYHKFFQLRPSWNLSLFYPFPPITLWRHCKKYRRISWKTIYINQSDSVM